MSRWNKSPKMFCIPSIDRKIHNTQKKKTYLVHSNVCHTLLILLPKKIRFTFCCHNSWTVIEAHFCLLYKYSFILSTIWKTKRLQKKRTEKAPRAACGNQSFFSVRFCWGDRKMPEASTFFSKQNSTTFFHFKTYSNINIFNSSLRFLLTFSN